MYVSKYLLSALSTWGTVMKLGHSPCPQAAYIPVKNSWALKGTVGRVSKRARSPAQLGAHQSSQQGLRHVRKDMTMQNVGDTQAEQAPGGPWPKAGCP